jgi:N-glycosylase/DNA lyase
MIKFKVNDFNLDDSITCGQIFRYDKEFDGSYTLPLNDRVVNVKQDGNVLYVTSNDEKDLESIIRIFFDLNTDYNEINNKIIKLDSNLKPIIDKCYGFKIFNLNPFETIISYIISANNNVSNIKKSVDMLSNKYGNMITWNNKDYYLFPTPESLKNITIEELNSMKMGFRSKYIYEIINKINNDDFDLDYINKLNTEIAIEYLTKYKGIGLKVASCILLFGYKRMDVFPIDTWVKKMMKELYGTENIKTIKDISKDKYGKYSGIVIQYMFHSKRNK